MNKRKSWHFKLTEPNGTIDLPEILKHVTGVKIEWATYLTQSNGHRYLMFALNELGGRKSVDKKIEYFKVFPVGSFASMNAIYNGQASFENDWSGCIDQLGQLNYRLYLDEQIITSADINAGAPLDIELTFYQ